jgi:hypothetical protein
MTYKELRTKLDQLPKEQLNQDVTVSCDISNECFAVKEIHCIEPDDFLADVLDEKHLVLTIDF